MADDKKVVFVDEEDEKIHVKVESSFEEENFGGLPRISDDDKKKSGDDDKKDTKGDGEQESSLTKEEIKRILEGQYAAQDDATDKEDDSDKKEDEREETYRKGFISQRIENCELKIESLEDKLIKAKEDGNTLEERKLQKEIDKLETEKEQFTRALNTPQEKPKKEEKKESKKLSEERKREIDAAAEWGAENKWYFEPKNDQQRAMKAYVNGIAGELKQRGVKESDPQFFREINEGLQKNFKTSKEGRSPVSATHDPQASADNDRGDGGKKGRTVVLTEQHRAMMKNLKLDPNNKEHQAEYAKQIARYEDEERKGAR